MYICAIVILSTNRRVRRIGGWGDHILERANVRALNINRMVWMDDTAVGEAEAMIPHVGTTI
jgi:hypothetical protein